MSSDDNSGRTAEEEGSYPQFRPGANDGRPVPSKPTAPFANETEPKYFSAEDDPLPGATANKKAGAGLLGEPNGSGGTKPSYGVAASNKKGVSWLAVIVTMIIGLIGGWIANDMFEYNDVQISNVFEQVFDERTTTDSSQESDIQPDASDNPDDFMWYDPTYTAYGPCGSTGVAGDSGIGVYPDLRGYGGCMAYNPLDSDWPSYNAEGVVLGCWAPNSIDAVVNAVAGQEFGQDFLASTIVNAYGDDPTLIQSNPEPYCAIYPAAQIPFF